ncbi:PaaI family thioesterase [Rhodococcus spelaei]|uniref:Acyl-coenzyme A thioesterase THEM4 n=1 Tax=Rhodococcus spelaei TaxID=2546320 RepID=A0A541BRX2_9NOCA|nr:PaaI family thioesterase [Rhodococcus spelaei]TQF75073.1 PaaI family thioesterase [Rhodococcus spelaei]
MSSTWTLPDDLDLPTRPDFFPAPGEALPQHWSKCFGCGDDQPSGMAMTFIAEEGIEVSGRLTVANRYQGGPGVIHGGILSVAFDETQGMACMLLGVPVVTGHLEIDFAKPIPLGSVLEFRARMDGMTGRKLYTSAEARIVEGPTAGDDVVATSRGLFLTIKPEHFTPMKDFVDGEATSPFGSSTL